MAIPSSWRVGKTAIAGGNKKTLRDQKKNVASKIGCGLSAGGTKHPLTRIDEKDD